MEKRVIIILLLVLVLIWILHDFRQTSQETYEKAYSYTFEGKTFQEVDDALKLEGERYMQSESEIVQIHSLVNMMECRHYLLYKNRSSLKKYYDFLKVVLHPNLRHQLKNKKEYTDEIGKFLRRKRKLGIEYLKYEVSMPSFVEVGQTEMAEVFIIRTTKEGKEYLKYEFRKHDHGRYYLYLDNTISLNQLKFKLKEKAEIGE